MTEHSESVRIESLAAGGDGIARLADGRVVFVPDTAPGDLVELDRIERSARLARAQVGQILEASPDRCAPRCRHAATCGGCTWQHVDYAAQLRAKAEIVRDALARIAGIDDWPLVEIVASPDPYTYRARARVVRGAAGFGYRKRGSHDIEVVEECPILRPEAAAALATLNAEASKNASDAPRAQSARKAEWEILCGSTGEAVVTRVEAERSRKRRSPKPKPTRKVQIDVLGEKLEASAGSFVQGNALLWDRLSSEVRAQCGAPTVEGAEPREEAETTAGSRLIELYAGIGFLTLPLARAGYSGALFESSRRAVGDLRANLRAAGFDGRFEIVGGRVEKRSDWAARFRAADVLLVDPPRTGLDSALCRAMAESGPARIVYVSCDPATLARDLKVLIQGGYRIGFVKALDLFPQTPHVETIVRLERVGR